MTEATQEDTSMLTHLKKYDVTLVYENTTMETLKGEDSNLPTDTHVVTYEVEGETKLDAVRSYKMSDIFDGYYDRGLTVKSIKAGYGKVKPNLWNIKDKEEEGKKDKKK